jgi:tRNA (guanine37-N1)-methyltransferase
MLGICSMRFDVISLFPDMFGPILSQGINRRAYQQGQLDVRFWNPRDFSVGQYRRVDDRPFGGGPGMVMLAEPLALAIEAAKADRADGLSVPVVLFSPIGDVLQQRSVELWAASEGAILICGRYEGVDQRLIERFVTHQVSLGDFVLSGGEIAAMALLDAIARLQPGVLSDQSSHQQDSFGEEIDGLLDCPHYTRPELWRGSGVPVELLSGHHAHIAQWRRSQRIALTAERRPDLMLRAREAGLISAQEERVISRRVPGHSSEQV